MVQKKYSLRASALSRRTLLQGLTATLALLPTARAGSSSKSRRPSGKMAVENKVPDRVGELSLEHRIGGVFAERFQVNVERQLLGVDTSVYLDPFKKRPKTGALTELPPGTAWLGEHVGKWLAASSTALRYAKHAPLQALTDRVAAELMATQEPDGYLGTYPLNFRWTAWDVWVHKYVLIGLLSYFDLTADEAVLDACRKMGNLLARTFGDAPGQRDITFNSMIGPDLKSGTVGGIESTSILEPVCGLYRRTGDRRYLEFASYIVRSYGHPHAPDLINASIDTNHIARGKAYEFISNLVGLVDLYQLTAEQPLLGAVMRHWEEISRHQVYLTGTAAAGENFQAPDHLLSLESSRVGENCVTVTWLQLNLRLLRLTGEARFGQEIEKTVYNQLLGAQDSETGGFSYFASLVGRKQYLSRWNVCCVSSGKRGIALLPQLVWGVEQDAFLINLYTPGRALFDMGSTRVELVTETSFPSEGSVSLRVNPQRPVTFTLKLRVPEWVGTFAAQVEGRTMRGKAGEMLSITRKWRPGSTVQVVMDMPLQVKSGAPTYPQYIALQRGPQLLVIEKDLNPSVPYLHRAALQGKATDVLIREVSAPAGWKGRQVYALAGVAGVANDSDELKLRSKPVTLTFVPFADAQQYRAWTTWSEQLRLDIPAVTAFASPAMSPRLRRPGVARIEAISDEDPATFCICNPQNYGKDTDRAGKLGSKGDPVSFSVTLEEGATVRRIVYRHGESSGDGGWFDTSQGVPSVEVLRTPANDPKKQWEPVGRIDAYPQATASSAPALVSGQAFEILLPEPARIFGVRVIGKPGGNYASCAELSAYA